MVCFIADECRGINFPATKVEECCYHNIAQGDVGLSYSILGEGEEDCTECEPGKLGAGVVG